MYTITLDTPPSVQDKLKKVVDLASKDFDSVPYEGDAEDTYGYETPKFINLHGLEYDILAELQVRELSCHTFFLFFFSFFFFFFFFLFSFFFYLFFLFCRVSLFFSILFFLSFFCFILLCFLILFYIDCVCVRK